MKKIDIKSALIGFLLATCVFTALGSSRINQHHRYKCFENANQRMLYTSVEEAMRLGTELVEEVLRQWEEAQQAVPQPPPQPPQPPKPAVEAPPARRRSPERPPPRRGRRSPPPPSSSRHGGSRRRSPPRHQRRRG